MRVFGIIATMGLISCSEDKNVDSNVDGTNDSDTESPVLTYNGLLKHHPTY